MQYEYKSVYSGKQNFFTTAVDTKALDQKLNEHAAHGWELVGFASAGWCRRGVVAVMKRPADGPVRH